MQEMSLRGLTVIAVLWTFGVATLAARIGGAPAILILAVFILPLVFSSIDAAWQASVLTPSLHSSGRSLPIQRLSSALESTEAAIGHVEIGAIPLESAAPDSIIPEPAAPAPAIPVALAPEPGVPPGEALQL